MRSYEAEIGKIMASEFQRLLKARPGNILLSAHICGGFKLKRSF